MSDEPSEPPSLDWSAVTSVGNEAEATFIVGFLESRGIPARIVDKSGAWFSYAKDRIGQGRENSRIFLRENPAILQEITAKLLEQTGQGQGAAEKEG